MFIPILHPARYLQAFYSAPQLKPPMCLQYAIWALASNGHDKYGHLHDIFYSRARQYLESDELKVWKAHLCGTDAQNSPSIGLWGALHHSPTRPGLVSHHDR